MVIALGVVFILFCGLTDGRLLYAQNMSNLMLQNGYVLVLACGMLLCILTGGNIDLSVGAVICMVGGLAAVMIGNKGMNPYLTIIICLVVGLLVGVWQGYWIGYKRIPPFITTLAGMFIFCIDRWYRSCSLCDLQRSSFQSKQSKKRISPEHSIF